VARVTLPLAGGCQCDACRYEVVAPPLTVYVCHCLDCQRQSTSGFGMSMPVPRTGLTQTRGEPRRWRRTAASGRSVVCAYCGDCGTRLFHAPERNDAIVNVKPGTLDDTSWLRPVGHLWTKRAQPWIVIPTDVLSYPSQPESFDALFAAWTARVD
jgi:hypothetical protein